MHADPPPLPDIPAPPCAPGFTPLGMGLLAAALALPAVQPAHADAPPERASLSFKQLDYVDSQPDAERVRVRAPALALALPIGSRWSLQAGAVSDAISGASPTYHTSGLKKLHDHRRAGDLGLTHYFDDGSLTLAGTVSSESDYFSRGLSLQGSWSSEDRNTTWTGGIGLSSDRIDPVNRVVVDERKRTSDLLAGLTQVLSPLDIVQLNLGLKQGRGYFSDPYKIFDRRPRERRQRTVLLRWNHHFEGLDGTSRVAWRTYDDSFGIRAHTLTLEYVQPLPGALTVTPLLRLYTQSAARFYLDADPSAAPFVPEPPAGAAFYSQDQRLSAFGAATVGLKLAWQPHADWTFDARVEHYRQHGSWRLFGSGSPGLAPLRARTLQCGVSYLF